MANESIDVGTSVTLDFQLAPKLSTFAVSSVVEWSDDGTKIVEDHRWGIDAVRRHLTEDGNVRVTLGLVPAPSALLPLQSCWANATSFPFHSGVEYQLATCRMQDQPRLVARAWANYYGQFINLVLSEQLNVPIQIWVLLAQLVVCTGLVTRTPHSNINSFFEQVRSHTTLINLTTHSPDLTMCAVNRWRSFASSTYLASRDISTSTGECSRGSIVSCTAPVRSSLMPRLALACKWKSLTNPSRA